MLVRVRCKGRLVIRMLQPRMVTRLQTAPVVNNNATPGRLQTTEACTPARCVCQRFLILMMTHLVSEWSVERLDLQHVFEEVKEALILALDRPTKEGVALRPQDVDLSRLSDGFVDLEILGEVLLREPT